MPQPQPHPHGRPTTPTHTPAGLRLARFRYSLVARLCVSDGVVETYRDFHVYAGQSHLVDDWDYLAGGVCVLQLLRPNGSVLVPADSFEWADHQQN